LIWRLLWPNGVLTLPRGLRMLPALRNTLRDKRRQTMHLALTIIRDEHHALSAMLRSIRLLLAEHHRRGTLPDFGVLRAMLFYVDEFPERLHHTKESELLFPMLRAHGSEIGEVLDRLDRDHAHGEHAIRNLEHDLLGFEMMGETAQGPQRREKFETAMNQYIDFYLAHMHLEESVVLPLAARVLSETDWLELDAAFTMNRDPLTGHDADGIYRPLFKRILMNTAAPVGLGPSLEALSGTGIARHAPQR
jgi:hemerythrin-like domain-containing protein